MQLIFFFKPRDKQHKSTYDYYVNSEGPHRNGTHDVFLECYLIGLPSAGSRPIIITPIIIIIYVVVISQ